MALLKQVTNVMFMNKNSLLDEESRKAICPNLSMDDLRFALSQYKPDKFDPAGMPKSVYNTLIATKTVGKQSGKVNTPTTASTVSKLPVDASLMNEPKFKYEELNDWNTNLTLPKEMEQNLPRFVLDEIAFLVSNNN